MELDHYMYVVSLLAVVTYTKKNKFLFAPRSLFDTRRLFICLSVGLLAEFHEKLLADLADFFWEG